MIQGLIGKKLGMTRIFDESGYTIPVTLIEMEPATVVMIKRADGKDKYNSVQVAFKNVKMEKITKPEQGHLKKAGVKDGYQTLKEFRTDDLEGMVPGEKITPEEVFKEKAIVKVVGTSKGHGFTGAMNRHQFAGAKRSHGQSKVHRKPMSAGSTDAARVFLGKRSPGHKGDCRITVRGLEIVKIKPVEGDSAGKCIIALKGAVPGKPNSAVLIENI